MDVLDIIPTYERLLREAAIASLEVDQFDLNSEDAESAAKFKALQQEAATASLALINFWDEEAHMLRLLIGTALGNNSPTIRAKLKEAEEQRAKQKVHPVTEDNLTPPWD